jgi:hypothetical protein
MKEKNLTFFKENGYQVLPGVIPQNVIEEVGNYLESERDKTLETIREDLPFNSIESLIAELGQLYKNKEKFAKLKKETQMAISGHFAVESRLSGTTKIVPGVAEVQVLLKKALNAENIKLHMPPTARFILPENTIAAVPPHQDIAYNKQVEDFIIMWVPFVDIDDECGGVVVHHGTGNLPEQPVESGDFWLQGVKSGSNDLRHIKMKKGDILLMNKYVVHESKGNTSNRTRYSIDFRLFDSRLKSSKHCFDYKTNSLLEPEKI